MTNLITAAKETMVHVVFFGMVLLSTMEKRKCMHWVNPA